MKSKVTRARRVAKQHVRKASPAATSQDKRLVARAAREARQDQPEQVKRAAAAARPLVGPTRAERDRARALLLRRLPAEVFDEAASQRGFIRTNGRALIRVDVLREVTTVLEATVQSMVRGGDIFSSLRAISKATAELNEYLKIAQVREEAEHDRARGARA